MAEYPELYMKTDWILRIIGMSKEAAGYELLRRAIVIWQVEGEKLQGEVSKDLSDIERDKLIESKLVERVAETASMNLSKKRVIKNERNAFSQAMIEEIRSISAESQKISILEFVQDMTKRFFAD